MKYIMKSTLIYQSTLNLPSRLIYSYSSRSLLSHDWGCLPKTDKGNQGKPLIFAKATRRGFANQPQTSYGPSSGKLKKEKVEIVKTRLSGYCKDTETFLTDSFSSFPLLKNCTPVSSLKTAYTLGGKVSPIWPLLDKINGRLCQQERQSRLLPTPKSLRPLSRKVRPVISPFEKKRKTLFYNKSHIATLSVQSTRNNTLLTLSGNSGKVLKGGWVSAGSLGFKNSRKSTTYASQAAAKSLALRAKRLGIRALHLRLQGTGRAKGAVVRTLRKSSLKVLVIRECTAALHNGCRRPKKRRI